MSLNDYMGDYVYNDLSSHVSRSTVSVKLANNALG